MAVFPQNNTKSVLRHYFYPSLSHNRTVIYSLLKIMYEGLIHTNALTSEVFQSSV